MNNFNLKKYLVENKLTNNSQNLSEEYDLVTLEKMLRSSHLDTDAEGILPKEKFLKVLQTALESGVQYHGENPDEVEQVRRRFVAQSDGDQSVEIGRAFDKGYDYQEYN